MTTEKYPDRFRQNHFLSINSYAVKWETAMPLELPILTGNDGHRGPADNTCLNCGVSLVDGDDYSAFILSGGAMLMTDDGRTGHGDKRLGGYLSFDTLRIEDGRQSSSQNLVVDNLRGGQFDLTWCSASCMSEWFGAIIKRMGSQSSQSTPEA
ncbi:MAG: hypothetical protein P1V19_15780 [Gimesia sp.]|nr:hypothetical protein [Gimesia sp.]